MENRFNLIDEPWIPVADVGRVSLRQLFSEPEYRALGGNPVQKIALMKLLLAIAQAAATPADDAEWRELGAGGLAKRCLVYLEKWHDRFYLYGEQPFLQMPAIKAAALQGYGAVMPEIATGNTTVLNHGQVEQALTDSEKAVLLVVMMAFALGGKKTDNRVTLSPGYAAKRNDKGRPSTGKPGPAVAHMGLLHNLMQGRHVWQTLWLNLLTQQQIQQAQCYPQGPGIPPWEQMPAGEDCPIARQLKGALMGRLVPLCRFCLISDERLHYSEGIAHGNYKEGVCDPSVAVNWSGKEPKALWVNPEKRPWREITALLGFFAQQKTQGFESLQLSSCLGRACAETDEFALWSGGLRVSSNAGEQYVSGNDDFVESLVWLHSGAVGDVWFSQLQEEMTALDAISKNLYGRVAGYFKTLLAEGEGQAALGTQMFWQLCERNFQELLDNCGAGDKRHALRQVLRRRFASYARRAYDRYCPRDTARQLDAWAKCRPNYSSYLKQEA